MKDFDGTWTGSNRLWFEDPNVPEVSPTTLNISGGTINYDWIFRGSPHRGEMVLIRSGEKITATWKDSWHSPQPMSCNGEIENGRINVLGHYGAGDQTWGWRT